jgi:hypothetical protein
MHPVASAQRAQARIAFERGSNTFDPVDVRRGVVVGNRDHVAVGRIQSAIEGRDLAGHVHPRDGQRQRARHGGVPQAGVGRFVVGARDHHHLVRRARLPLQRREAARQVGRAAVSRNQYRHFHRDVLLYRVCAGIRTMGSVWRLRCSDSGTQIFLD